ncbi:hypothetical protein [Croceitalea rosinachiae]|uniref:Uncharacterized protein n=1 Tax=Croceitalea rosinachiae TaxID=3075596 RepID=A0ABU3A5J4_9FLAO|nr:hypothetical protein [Croceitalea sp. F388]MDT0605442.1 hypothetical protein [Croceitalea sp. F388]
MKKDEFYIGYVDEVGIGTKKTLKRFVIIAISVLMIGALLFGFFQRPAINSSFDFGNPTKVSGLYHESPYPMLRVAVAENEFKDLVLLGVGKFGPNPYLKEIREKEGGLNGKQLTIEGQLVYYNGKTLLEIDDSQNVSLANSKVNTFSFTKTLGQLTVEGEVIDPKCYFGVMKPGFGKIHRSCASLCIAGGVPPVLVSNGENGVENYFLLTDLKGNPIHRDILPYIGQPSKISGALSAIGDWKVLKINVDQIEKLDKKSSIY